MSYSDNYYNDQTYRGSYNDQGFRGFNDQRFAATSGYGHGGGYGGCSVQLPSLCTLVALAGLVALTAAAVVALQMLLMGGKKRRKRNSNLDDDYYSIMDIFVVKGNPFSPSDILLVLHSESGQSQKFYGKLG